MSFHGLMIYNEGISEVDKLFRVTKLRIVGPENKEVGLIIALQMFS